MRSFKNESFFFTFLALLLDLGLKTLILLGAVDEEPREALAEQSRTHGNEYNQEAIAQHFLLSLFFLTIYVFLVFNF